MDRDSGTLINHATGSTTDEPEICEYPDSGKYLAESGAGSGHPFGAIGRIGQDIDYWDGEK